ncbi:MAG: YebC/PmpR family DNA-binding transcriptional regulator [Candidatus Izimaplasma sp.]|nr:YebC/PmpR family DNA-binding transcriptional regulator [Candidatus Izimaplasma bacterium]
MGRKFEVRKAAMAKTMLHKSKLYSRYGKEIYMVAKNGGANPDGNLSLKHLIERAKKAQVPTDVIKRNIQKAERGLGEDFQPVRYEGFGPGGIGIIVDTLTDNVNRTVSEVRNCFTKIGAKMGRSGTVEHSFDHLSHTTIKGMSEEEAFEILLMADIDILEISEEDGLVEIEADGYDLDKIQETLTEANASIEIIEAESSWYPQNHIEISPEEQALFDKFMVLANDVEDIQEVYHNIKED